MTAEPPLNPLNSAAEPVVPTGEVASELSNFLNWGTNEPSFDHLDSKINDIDNQLIQVKLGVAAGLFHALLAKHYPTAAHSLRVAKLCSQWAQAYNLDPVRRDQLEVAALLHDVGKIGVPDYVLSCPGKLSVEEQSLMNRNLETGLNILTTCCADEQILEIVRCNYAWFDGSHEGSPTDEDTLPLESRMLSIADAFDSMTVDQTFRHARSREMAIAELFAYAGSQFDPELVEQFSKIHARLTSNDNQRTRGWLRGLNPSLSDQYWKANGNTNTTTDAPIDSFETNLIRHIHDAIICVDVELKIVEWNQAAERISGLSRDSVLGHYWGIDLLHLVGESGRRFTQQTEPVGLAIRHKTQVATRLSITDAANRCITVMTHIVPVVAKDGTISGATIQMHDTSSMESLEQEIQSLHYKATRDPLTGLFNRAEMDRNLSELVDHHSTSEKPFSLIICDIDFFKRINDTYGHQAGDEALRSFAAQLQKHAEVSDLVARYGGEEFVLLCPGRNNDTATALAERIRADLASTNQSALGGKNMTASFGVTQLQRGDSADTVLNRADRALLQSKEMGRNIVTQVGAGMTQDNTDRRSWWRTWLSGKKLEVVVRRIMKTNVPPNLTVEKIRGFVVDHKADVLEVESNRIKLVIDGESLPMQRRAADRLVPLTIEIHLKEFQAKSGGQHTEIDVSIAPRRNRDRRTKDAVKRARHLANSLHSYLVAYESVNGVADVTESKKTGWLASFFEPKPIDDR